MPEGPEVETIRLDIEPLLLDQAIQSAWVSRVLYPTAQKRSQFKRLTGKTISALGRHGKLLWINTTQEQSLLVRLGMSGRLRVQQKESAVEKHTHVRIQLKSNYELRYIDPRRFGSVTLIETEAEKISEIKKMGPDPLSWNLKQKKEIIKRIQKSERSIKTILLDQSILAGVGNIYASEALFVAKIAPDKKGSELPATKLLSLLDATQNVMELALQNRGTSFMSYVDGWGKKGDNFSRLWVFARTDQSCKICRTSIQQKIQAGRSTFYCPKCQK
jgi:formamidopyrimidine-DNA glycosylase